MLPLSVVTDCDKYSLHTPHKKRLLQYDVNKRNAEFYFYCRLGPNLWNSLNSTTRELPRKRFKTEIHKMLLSFLASEDIYIESPSIIQKLTSTCSQ